VTAADGDGADEQREGESSIGRTQPRQGPHSLRHELSGDKSGDESEMKPQARGPSRRREYGEEERSFPRRAGVRCNAGGINHQCIEAETAIW
jgi:hypothetical protein